MMVWLQPFWSWITNNWLFVFSAVILICFIFSKDDNFFDFKKIIGKQLKVFVNCKKQYILYYGLPILLAIATLGKQTINDSILNSINVVISILLASLLAILGVISPLPASMAARKQLKDETINLILFESLLSVFSLVISFVIMFSSSYDGVFGNVASFLLYYFLYTLILHLLIVFKRVSVLLRKEN